GTTLLPASVVGRAPNRPVIRGGGGPEMSASSKPTLHPRFASATATLAETVLFPTPPLPEPTRTTFFTEGTRSLGLCCLAGEGRTLAPNATSTRGSCSGESMARTASSIRALCGEAGVGSSTRTRTPPPSSISGCLKYPSSDIGRPDEGSLRSFSAERTCSADTPIGRRNVRGAPGQVKASGGAAGRDVPSCASRCRGRAVRSPPRTEYLPDTPSVSRTWRYPGWSRDRTRPGPPSCPPGSTRDPAAPAGAPAGRSFSGPPPRP